MNDKIALFNSQKTSSGKYRLYWTNPTNGKTKTVSGIGMGTCEFEIVHIVANRPYVVIKRHGNTRGAARPRLFLVNYKSGAIVPEMPFGTFEIIIDETTKNIYFNALTSAGQEMTKYSWCLPHGGVPTMVLNTPSRLLKTSTVISNKTKPLCIIPLTIDIKPRPTQTPTVTGRKRGRPLGSKNKPKTVPTAPVAPQLPTAPIKRKRGRPLGSKNKPKITSAPTAPAIPKRTTHSAYRKAVKRNLYGTYYDIYVNNKRIATQRLNAELKTFMNDKILSVQYALPSALLPVYDIVLPNLKIWHTNAKNKYSNTPAMPTYLADGANGLKIKLSNGGTTTISDKSLSQMPNAVFLLATENQTER